MTSVLSPLTLGRSLVLHNRVALAPLTNRQSHENGSLGEDEYNWLVRRAADGIAFIESCATHVTLDGKGFPKQLGIFDDSLLDDWRRLADGVHTHNSTLFAQLYHGGARSPKALTGNIPLSASASGEGDSEVRAATIDDINRFRAAFVSAAQRAENAGLDGVEIHGAHGYLLTQFITPDTNQRDDQYGGCLENRARLIREITRETRADTKPEFVVGVRLSPENWGPWKGLDLDESIQIARWLAEDGADFIHISLWDAGPNTQKYPDRHATSMLREALPANVALFVAGQIWTLDEAQRQLDLGADVVALGRAAIINPDWVKTVATGEREPTRPPLTVAELAARDIGPDFAQYLRNWKNFVAD